MVRTFDQTEVSLGARIQRNTGRATIAIPRAVFSDALSRACPRL
jgi:hypothetical protein